MEAAKKLEEFEEQPQEEGNSVFDEIFSGEVQEKLAGLSENEARLRNRIEELSSSMLPQEVIDAKVAVLSRKIEEALSDEKSAEKLRDELAEVTDQHAHISEEIKSLSAEIDSIEAKKIELAMEFLRDVQPLIKQEFVERIKDALDFVEAEFESCQSFCANYGIVEKMGQRWPSFFRSDFRIFREKPWQETRDRLDKWLP